MLDGTEGDKVCGCVMMLLNVCAGGVGCGFVGGGARAWE